jgi:hypothetical protein
MSYSNYIRMIDLFHGAAVRAKNLEIRLIWLHKAHVLEERLLCLGVV